MCMISSELRKTTPYLEYVLVKIGVLNAQIIHPGLLLRAIQFVS